jgi:hypothetical protein
MGFLSSLKRLFFTTESVAKSAVDKAVDYTKEKAEDIVVAAKETATDFSEKTAGLRETVMEKANAAIDKVETVAESAWDKTKEVASDVADAAEIAVDKAGDLAESAWDKTKDTTANVASKAKDTAEDVGEFVQSSYEKTTAATSSTVETAGNTFGNILDKTKDAANNVIDKISENEMVKKAGDVVENVGAKVMATGEVLADKAADISENVGAKVLESSDKAWDKIGEAKDVLAEKAKDVAAQIGQKFDATVDKAEAFLAEEDAKPKKDFADETLTTGGDLLAGKDDFFAKASQYAEGDYDAFSEGKITITQTEKVEKSPAKTAGQDDHDGDGNEQIDDAIIVES